jgi:hypothetical protein
MSRAPQSIAVLLVVGASLWTLTLASNPDEPFAMDSGVLISIGLLLFSVIAAVGLLIPRGRWARNLARGLLAAEALLATVTPLRAWAIAALVATGLGIVGVQGKWLNGWLRRLPSAEGPGLLPILFIIGSLALVPILGVASPGGVEFRQGLLGAAGIVIAWSYGKANIWAVWTGRLLLTPLAIVAATAASFAGAALILVAGAGPTWLAWTREVWLAASPLLDTLPGPRTIRPRQDGTE